LMMEVLYQNTVLETTNNRYICVLLYYIVVIGSSLRSEPYILNKLFKHIFSCIT